MTDLNLVLIKGAGDIASGIALRLHRAGFKIIMTELASPSSIRRTVSFSQAVTQGSAKVENIQALLAEDINSAKKIIQTGAVAVIVDGEGCCAAELRPKIIIDAIMAKRNCGTTINCAPCVIGVGPGFTAGKDCHAVVETARGHTLGRVFYADSSQKEALPNTGVPGDIGGFSRERIVRAPAEGAWTALAEIGTHVKTGDAVGEVCGQKVYAQITGILRGILPSGFAVQTGTKAGDIDPRCKIEHCYTVSDKALAVAGGVLEAMLNLNRNINS